MSKLHRTHAGLFALSCAALLTCGCGDPPTGPSLAAVNVSGLTTASLRPTDGNPAACCCKATGRAVNGNAVPVHVTLKINGYDGSRAQPITSTFYFISDLQPNAAHDIDASGFMVACNAIQELKYEVDVRSTASPQ